MGKGVVLKNIGDGLYSVRIEFDTTRAENRIIALRDNVARILAEISELDAEIAETELLKNGERPEEENARREELLASVSSLEDLISIKRTELSETENLLRSQEAERDGLIDDKRELEDELEALETECEGGHIRGVVTNG